MADKSKDDNIKVSGMIGVADTSGEVLGLYPNIEDTTPKDDRHYIGPSEDLRIAFPCEMINPRFKGYLIETSYELIESILEKNKSLSKERKSHMMGTVLKNIYQYTDEQLNAHYEAQNKEWNDWCSDVGIYFIVRKLIFDTDIPVVGLGPKI